MKKKRTWPQKLYLALMLVFLYAPILVLIVYSFNTSRTMGNWTGFTLDWYAALLKDKNIMEALKVTLSIAFLSSLCATVLGVTAAIGINSMKRRSRNLVMAATNIPVINPDLVTGVSLMMIFAFLTVPPGYTTLLLAHITFNIPYVILSVLPKLRQTSNALYEAALDLGASPTYALRKVILPQIMPGIVSGAILAFTLSLDDFVISFFTRQGVQNLSIYIYSLARKGINPKINALSAIMFVVVLTLLLVVNLTGNRDDEECIRAKKRKTARKAAKKAARLEGRDAA